MGDFILVTDYWRYSDFMPPLIEKRGSLPRLDGLLLAEHSDDAAEKCARVFRTASHLQLPELQLLCVNQLKVLYLLSPLRILIVAKIFLRSVAWGCDAETDFLDWLVDHVSEYYWLLTREHGRQLVDVLDGCETMKRRVTENISADPNMGRRGLYDN